jgi:hypothetical protein
MEEVKELIFDLLLFGHTVNEEELISMLGILNSKTFEDSSDVSNALFVEKCLPFFVSARKELDNDEEIVSIDLSIDEYKRLLVKDEQYNLISILNL